MRHESQITIHKLRPHAPGLADFAAIIGSEELDRAAHFIEPGPDPHTQPVGERILTRGRDRLARWELGSPWCGHRSRPGVIEIIRCEQRDAPFVVPGIEDVTDGFESPWGRFAGPEIIEEQNGGSQHGLKHAEFAGLTFRIVASLNFLEQLAVIVKKSRVPAQNDLPERGYREVRLARAAWPHQQQARVGAGRIIAGKRFRDQLGLLEAAVPRGPVGAGVINVLVKVVEVAVFVAVRNARAPHRTSGAILARAIAGHCPNTFARVCALDGLLPRNALWIFFSRDALDGLPSSAAA